MRCWIGIVLCLVLSGCEDGLVEACKETCQLDQLCDPTISIEEVRICESSCERFDQISCSARNKREIADAIEVCLALGCRGALDCTAEAVNSCF